MAATLKRSALEAAGQVARFVPLDQVQMFAFIASSAVRADPWTLYRRLHERAAIRGLLGVPESDRARFLGWARHLAPPLDISLFRDEEKERLGDEAAVEITRFLEELVSDASRRDPDGLLAALVAAEEEGDRLN